MSMPARRQSSALLTILVVAGLLSSCGPQPSTPCPTSVEAARSDAVLDATGTTLVAVARVARFVPSPDVRYRGYDLDVRRVVVGDAPESVMFLRVPDPVSGIQRGSPVLVVAVQDRQRPELLAAGPCPPLQTMSEAVFIRWTGER
jgi:hypothetical protein